MPYHDVADAASVTHESVVAVVAAGRELVLVGHAGSVYTLDRRCPHMGGDLAAGALVDGVLTCPRHGSRFDVTTGRCLEGPRILLLRLPGRDATTYPTTVEHGRVLVDLP